jgi:hypothetical protein
MTRQLPPPPKRPPPDPLDIELRDMSDAIVLGMPRVPPPPPPSAALMRDEWQESALAHRHELSVGSLITRILLVLLFVVMSLLFWSCWRAS